AAASVTLVVVASTLIFLLNKSRPAFAHAGVIGFFTTSVWNPSSGQFGVLGLLTGTLIIATIAMTIAVPVGVTMALFINEYAPAPARRFFTTMIDLLAALPSIIVGIWGYYAFKEHLVPVERFLGGHFSAVGFLRITPGAALVGSSFI